MKRNVRLFSLFLIPSMQPHGDNRIENLKGKYCFFAEHKREKIARIILKKIKDR